MRTFNIVVERDPDTGLYVGYVPGWPGAHSQGKALTSCGGIFKKSLRCSSKMASRNSSLNLSASRRSRWRSSGVDPGPQAARSRRSKTSLERFVFPISG